MPKNFVRVCRRVGAALAFAAAGAVTAGTPAAAASSLAGSAYAWGDNSFGQLGLGDISAKLTPTRFSTPAGVSFTAVSGGGTWGVALDHAGDAWAWGDNGSGQLGDGTTQQRPVPGRISMPAGVTFTRISAGYDHALALDSTGRVWSWGGNSNGQLGDGSAVASRSAPVAVAMPAGVTVTTVAAGFLTSYALDSAGHAWAWGYDGLGQLGDGSTTTTDTPVAVSMPAGVTFASIAGGYFWATALDSAGAAWAWGSGGSGQLGDGSTGGSPVPVAVTMPAGVRFASISAGWDTGYGLDPAGDAWAWGADVHGELGTGGSSGSDVPVGVSMPGGVTFSSIAGGAFHVLALDHAGNAWSWGRGDTGQSGDGTTTSHPEPAPVTMPAGVSFAAAADSLGFALALDGSGSGWGWGQNTGQLANGEFAQGSAAPNSLPLPNLVTSVAAGYDSGAAVDDSGQGWAWGQNAFGQLGDGSTTPSTVPVAVSMPAGVHFTAVSAGSWFDVALDSDGHAWAWGVNTIGQLGDGDNTGPQNCVVEGGDNACSTVPVQVAAPAGVVFTAIATGGMHVLALDDHGGVWAWGSNSADQLGTVTSNDSYVPSPVSTPPGVTFIAVAAGFLHSLALDSNGVVWSWGSSTYGESGRVSASSVPAPVTIPTSAHITGIAAGTFHSLAVDAAGALWAWGLNSSGQLGDGTDTGPESCSGPQVPPQGTACSVVPVQATSPSGVSFVAVAAGNVHSLALDSTGHAWGWGGGGLGEVGDGALTQAQLVPAEALTPAGTVFTAIAAGQGISYGIGQPVASNAGVPDAPSVPLLLVAVIPGAAILWRRRRG